MIVVLLAAAVAAGSGCLPVMADRIYARDLVEAVPAFGAVKGDLVLSYAPLPGVRRVFPVTELRQVLTRHQVSGYAESAVCFEWPMKRLDPLAVRTAMKPSLGNDGASLTIIEVTRQLVPEGALSFPLTGLRPPVSNSDAGMWRGHVEYAPGRRIAVWARVQIRVPLRRVVATRQIRAGEQFDVSNVRLESVDAWPEAAQVVRKLEDILGRTARRHIAQGAAISASVVDDLVSVRRGERIHVEVLAGMARVGFDGTAESSAAEGQYVNVRNPINRKLVRARVVSPGRAVINLGH